MRIYLANSSEQQFGGGFSFIHNFRKGMGSKITDDYEAADVYFIPSPSMVQREKVIKAKDEGKKIILRIDNAVRNSRNRNTGMSRMLDFAGWADLIVYQSRWAREYLMPFLGKDGPVIHNGIDTSVFNRDNRNNHDHMIYLYSRFNRDETKNWEAARYWYSKMQRKDRSAELWIVGNFSPELIDGNFDFYNGENYKFWGVQPAETLASIYKQSNALIYTYFCDACSNTLIEALCCGLRVEGYPFFAETGGSPEILQYFNDPFKYEDGLKYFGLERMCRQYIENLKTLKGIDV